MTKSLPKFAKNFFLWTITLQLIVWQIHTTPILADYFQNGLASVAGHIYSAFSNNFMVKENLLIHSETGRYVVVDSQCTGLSLIATLLAGIFSLSYKTTNKLVMAVLATVLIQIENIIRITHLFYEVKEPINHFEIYHLYVWQLINFAFALAIFFFLNQYFHQKEQDFVKNNNNKQFNPHSTKL